MRKWYKSEAGIVSGILLGISGFLLYYAWKLSDGQMCWIRDFTLGLATNLLGIIVTVSFVQYFLDRHNMRQEHQQENLK